MRTSSSATVSLSLFLLALFMISPTDLLGAEARYSIIPLDIDAVPVVNGANFDNGANAGTVSFGLSINDTGQVTGTHEVTFPEFSTLQAFLYSNGNTLDLGALGGSFSFSSAINNHGDVVGFSDVGLYFHGFVYRQGILSDIGGLGGQVGQTIPGHWI